MPQIAFGVDVASQAQQVPDIFNAPSMSGSVKQNIAIAVAAIDADELFLCRPIVGSSNLVERAIRIVRAQSSSGTFRSHDHSARPKDEWSRKLPMAAMDREPNLVWPHNPDHQVAAASKSRLSSINTLSARTAAA
ncbi:hypothetical protein [Caulobacter sp. 602-2]|uniref:hypothetical protein n=1 Tax=Caulobacter sp. 602-2 TaxID=2710887 RepID=UPI001F106AA7|nr:hypothetical protein [Caulobacter sp. 602-2]